MKKKIGIIMNQLYSYKYLFIKIKWLSIYGTNNIRLKEKINN